MVPSKRWGVLWLRTFLRWIGWGKDQDDGQYGSLVLPGAEPTSPRHLPQQILLRRPRLSKEL